MGGRGIVPGAVSLAFSLAYSASLFGTGVWLRRKLLNSLLDVINKRNLKITAV